MGRFNAKTAEMVGFKAVGRTRGQNNLNPAAIHHHGCPASIRARIKRGRRGIHPILNDAHPATDLNRFSVEGVYLAANAEGDMFANPGPDGFLHGRRIGNIPDHRPLGILLEQFRQQDGPVTRCACAATIGQVPKHNQTVLRFNGRSHALLHRNHIGMKRVPLGPAGFFDLLGNVVSQGRLVVGSHRHIEAGLGRVGTKEPTQQGHIKYTGSTAQGSCLPHQRLHGPARGDIEFLQRRGHGRLSPGRCRCDTPVKHAGHDLSRLLAAWEKIVVRVGFHTNQHTGLLDHQRGGIGMAI